MPSRAQVSACPKLRTNQRVFTMAWKSRGAAAVTIGLSMTLAATGCAGGSSGGGNGGGSSGGAVTVTLWENATNGGTGVAYFQNAANQFHVLHPNVTIKLQTIQNEDLDGKLQTALDSDSAPDIFLQRGGGKMLAEVKAGELQPLNLTAVDQAN